MESHHRHLKTALDQALILRGQRDFASLAEYRTFVDQLVARRNRRREAKVRAETAALRPLPPRRTTDFAELVTRVTRTGGFLVHGVFHEPRRRGSSATACASTCMTTASRPGSAARTSSLTPADAPPATASACTWSTTAT